MQKRHRIFIAINLPDEIKKALVRYGKKWKEVPAKWTPEENLHITLVFLGDLTDEELGEVCIIAKKVASKHSSTDIALRTIAYGPEHKLSFGCAQDKPPRYIWAGGEKSKALSLLKNDLQNSLLEKINFAPDIRAFSPHVTLARVNAFAWQAIEPEERPEVNENIDLTFTVESIEVMESMLKRTGPQYIVIEYFPFT